MYSWVPKGLGDQEIREQYPQIIRKRSQLERLQGIMVAVTISSRGITYPSFVHHGLKLDGAAYLKLLETELLPKALAQGIPPEDLKYVHDGAPAHQSKVGTSVSSYVPFCGVPSFSVLPRWFASSWTAKSLKQSSPGRRTRPTSTHVISSSGEQWTHRCPRSRVLKIQEKEQNLYILYYQ